MNIAIYGRNFGKNYSGMLIQLLEEIKANNINVYINRKFNDFITSKILYQPKIKGEFDTNLPKDVDFDFFLSIGGDGTMLESATIIGDREIPVLGFNTGKLGFTSYVNSNNSITAIKQLLNKEFTIDKRMLLEISSKNSLEIEKPYCLNEFALQKKSGLNMIKLKVFANNDYINTYWSDGLIVSTPTGSTAYSLSCGGPIVTPQSDVILITPIANHNLTVRPLIISADSEIKILVESNERKVLASLDCRTFSIKKYEEIYIKKANFFIYFVNLFENNYFSTLRNKLMWGTDIRN